MNILRAKRKLDLTQSGLTLLALRVPVVGKVVHRYVMLWFISVTVRLQLREFGRHAPHSLRGVVHWSIDRQVHRTNPDFS